MSICALHASFRPTEDAPRATRTRRGDHIISETCAPNPPKTSRVSPDSIVATDRRVYAPAGRRGPSAEQELVEFMVAEFFRQRPAELGGLGQFQILVNSALDDRATAGDLVLRQSHRRQPQGLADLAHGQSLFRQS